MNMIKGEGPITRTPNSIFNDNELIKIWLSMLLQKHNKRFTIYLTQDEINNEIEEIKGAIDNEKMWAMTDSIHEGNISTLCSYLKVLDKLLEERKDFENNKLTYQNIASFINALPKTFGKNSIHELTIDEINSEIEYVRNNLHDKIDGKTGNLYLSRLLYILDEKQKTIGGN